MKWAATDIKAFRDELALTVEELAAVTGVDPRSVLRWESDITHPTPSAEALLSAYKLQWDTNISARSIVLEVLTAASRMGGIGALVMILLKDFIQARMIRRS